MKHCDAYRVEVSACPRDPGHFRWSILKNGQVLDIPGYAYHSAWSAEEAGRTALHWHLVLEPSRSREPTEAQPDERAA